MTGARHELLAAWFTAWRRTPTGGLLSMQDSSISMQDVLGHHAGEPGGLHATQDISVVKARHVGPSRNRMQDAQKSWLQDTVGVATRGPSHYFPTTGPDDGGDSARRTSQRGRAFHFGLPESMRTHRTPSVGRRAAKVPSLGDRHQLRGWAARTPHSPARETHTHNI